eukprot:1141735_1
MVASGKLSLKTQVAEESSSSPPLPTGLDRYKREGRIGEGTYGVVYRAIDRVTGEYVAVKRIRSVAEKEGFPLTSVREIKILQRLSHPNIVDLRGWFIRIKQTQCS